MTNCVYLIKSASFEPNIVYYKVGYTSNIMRRIIPYITHNPSSVLMQTVSIYGKTKRKLENAVHAEIEKKGFVFKRNDFLNMKTEWFAVDTRSQFYQDIELNGLQVFKACKNRKSIIEYSR